MKSGVVIEEDTITIYARNGQEIVRWIESEWQEDASIVLSITNAICIYYKEGEKALVEKIIARAN